MSPVILAPPDSFSKSVDQSHGVRGPRHSIAKIDGTG